MFQIIVMYVHVLSVTVSGIMRVHWRRRANLHLRTRVRIKQRRKPFNCQKMKTVERRRNQRLKCCQSQRQRKCPPMKKSRATLSKTSTRPRSQKHRIQPQRTDRRNDDSCASASPNRQRKVRGCDEHVDEYLERLF